MVGVLRLIWALFWDMVCMGRLVLVDVYLIMFI